MKKLGRVLIVDDEENIRLVVERGLRVAGFDTTGAERSAEALELVASWRPDIILLDVMLPGSNGFDLLAHLRSNGDTTPVIFLTARDSTGDRVRGLTEGGVDYITKPFAVAEVVARVRLRVQTVQSEDRLRCGPITVDTERREATLRGEPIRLSPTEFRLLGALVLNQGHVLTRTQIIDTVWGLDFDGDDGIVDKYISYLRSKLGSTDGSMITTVRGVGFMMRNDR